MKNFWKIFKYVILSALSVAALILTTYYYYIGGDGWFGCNLERACYGIWCITFAACFYDMVDRFIHLWAKIIAAVATSLIYTAFVLFLNNLWRYICINHIFRWEQPVALGTVLKWDLTYTYNYGEYRYPLIFGIIFVICGLMIILSRPKIKAIYRNQYDKLCNWLYN